MGMWGTIGADNGIALPCGQSQATLNHQSVKLSKSKFKQCGGKLK